MIRHDRAQRGEAATKKRSSTDFTDFTDRELIRTERVPIRVIRVIRGKIFAELGDFAGGQRKKRKEELT